MRSSRGARFEQRAEAELGVEERDLVVDGFGFLEDIEEELHTAAVVRGARVQALFDPMDPRAQQPRMRFDVAEILPLPHRRACLCREVDHGVRLREALVILEQQEVSASFCLDAAQPFDAIDGAHEPCGDHGLPGLSCLV